MRLWRAHVPGDWRPGDRVPLSSADAHHVLKVLRLKDGAELAVFNGHGSEWTGTLERDGAGRAAVVLEQPRTDPVEASTAVTLYQAACRADRLEWVLQKGTEIGVHAFRLVRTARSSETRRGGFREARWRRILEEACKQSGRRSVPELYPPVPLNDPGILDSSRSVSIVLDSRPGTPGLSSSLDGLTGGPIRLLVGPESGFSGPEIDLLVKAGWNAACMGPRTLRTETAGLVAAALVLSALGDLGG